MTAPLPAAPLVLLVQPPAWRGDATSFDARPLAALLSSLLGQAVEAEVSDDVLSHWRRVAAAPDYALAFDEAHFTDYRIRRHGFQALVRDTVDQRFRVLVRPRTLITGPADLAARRIAAPAPPSLGALRLMALFPQVARAPRLVVTDSRGEALTALAAGEVDAALLPVDAVDVSPAVPALVTDVSPGRALSGSGALTARQRHDLVRALTVTPPGGALRRALAALGVAAFEVASDEAYEDGERLLRGTWGYR